jgi:hypothetical protein
LRARTQRDYSGEDEYLKLRNSKIATEHEIATLKLRQLKGELLERTQVMLVFAQIVAAMKGQVLSLPNRLMYQVAGKTPAEANAIMRAGVRLCLHELARFDVSKLPRKSASRKNSSSDDDADDDL